MTNNQGPQASPVAQEAHDPLAPQDPPPPQNPQIPPVPQAHHVSQALQVPQQPTLHMPLNWSHFKPKFSGKPDEDAKAHLLRTNDWMDTHRFQDNDRVQRFCLTLTGEARLWYKSLRPINIDWLGLQNTFREQYSKIGNTREQLYHAWRSFHFDENVETMDTYIHCIRQVATLIQCFWGTGSHFTYQVNPCSAPHIRFELSMKIDKLTLDIANLIPLLIYWW